MMRTEWGVLSAPGFDCHLCGAAIPTMSRVVMITKGKGSNFGTRSFIHPDCLEIAYNIMPRSERPEFEVEWSRIRAQILESGRLFDVNYAD